MLINIQFRHIRSFIAVAQEMNFARAGPLPVLLRSLEVLRDLRLAADRRDIATRHDDLGRLRRAVRGKKSK